MMKVTVLLKDGTEKVFPETSMAGGSYSTRCETKEGWLVIEDAYGARTMIPSAEIKEVKTDSYRHGGW
jgi:hypothetical protein